MAWTSAADIIDGWVGESAPSDPAKVEVWIGRAERLIRRSVPDLQPRLDSEAEAQPPSTDLLDTVRDVVAEMVTEVFLNPERKRSSQITSGPFTENTTFGGDNPGRLVLTSDQLALLQGVRGASGKAFNIDTSPDSSAVIHSDTCSLRFGGKYCSCGAILTRGYPLYGSSTDWL